MREEKSTCPWGYASFLPCTCVLSAAKHTAGEGRVSMKPRAPPSRLRSTVSYQTLMSSSNCQTSAPLISLFWCWRQAQKWSCGDVVIGLSHFDVLFSMNIKQQHFFSLMFEVLLVLFEGWQQWPVCVCVCVCVWLKSFHRLSSPPSLPLLSLFISLFLSASLLSSSVEESSKQAERGWDEMWQDYNNLITRINKMNPI